MQNTLYLRFNKLSIFFIYMLFAVGGLVRSTGSGMGCPDWPKCFGEYIPPTNVDQLPSDYQEFFTTQRIKKTERFASLVEKLGFVNKASQIREYEALEQKHDFNVVKAYVEYLNRLWGAVTGLIVFICFILSFKYLGTNTSVFIYTLLGFIAVFANALLGAVVVHSNLIGGIVTAHFILAFAALGFFIVAYQNAHFQSVNVKKSSQKWLAYTLLFITSLQVVLGAQVREIYDLWSASTSGSIAAENLYPKFHIHALVGIVVSVVSIYQFIVTSKTDKYASYFKYIAILAVAQLPIGLLALNETLAATSKLFHISIGAGIFLLQFYICSAFSPSKQNRQK